jgi:hypothetical protein
MIIWEPPLQRRLLMFFLAFRDKYKTNKTDETTTNVSFWLQFKFRSSTLIWPSGPSTLLDIDDRSLCYSTGSDRFQKKLGDNNSIVWLFWESGVIVREIDTWWWWWWRFRHEHGMEYSSLMGSRPNNQLWSLDQTFHFWSIFPFFLFVSAHVIFFYFSKDPCDC